LHKSFIIIVIKGTIIAIAVTIFLSLIQAALTTYYLIGFKLIALLSILITSVSIFIGALYSSKRGKRKGYLSGILVAALYMVFIILFSKLSGNQIYFDISTFGRIALAIFNWTIKRYVGY